MFKKFSINRESINWDEINLKHINSEQFTVLSINMFENNRTITCIKLISYKTGNIRRSNKNLRKTICKQIKIRQNGFKS